MKAAELDRYIGDIARHLLGPENPILSTRDQLRWGTHGSLAVDIAGPKIGSWFDHETEEGGGPLQLLLRKGGMVNGAALEWLDRELGLKVEQESGTSKRIAATYNYHDETGTLLFQKVRYEPKSFSQRQPDGHGGWIWNTRGVRKVLYRLPELYAAPPDAVIYIVEGEKDVDAAHALGLIATGNPDGGSLKPAGDRRPGKWRVEFNEFLRNRRVAVIPDNDEVGIAHATAVAASVATVARVKIVQLPGVGPKGDLSDWIAAGGTREALDQLAAVASDFQPPVASALAKPKEPNIRPGTHTVIEVGGGRLPFAVDSAELCLVRYDKNIFQRGDFIVRPAVAGIPIADDRQTPGLRLVRVGVQHLVERFTRLADFKKYDARTKEWVSIDCPANVAAAYLDRTGMWKLPTIAGIVNAPTLRPDGSIIDEPGYDTATSILYDPGSIIFYPLPKQPTREDARAALDKLISLIEEFPFVSDDDGEAAGGRPSPSRSVALSGILTAMIGPSIPAAPLHAITATEAGSGKSKLADIVSMIATGHECPVIAQGKTEEEMEKRLGAALLAGDTLINFDNCELPLGGEQLCQALTQTLLKVRILGKSEQPTVLCNAVFFATGNNLAVIGDMARRTIRCALDPKMERPETREFRHDDPVKRVRADRRLYVAAALTVLRAFFAAGRPQQSRPLGSFEAWSRTVRDALLWLDEPDPCLTMERARQEDPYRRALADVLYQWHAVIGDGEVSVKRVIEYATEFEPRPLVGLNASAMKHPDFREALLVVAGNQGNINSRRLGIWLRRMKGKVVDGLRVEEGLGRDHGGLHRWKVVEVAR